MVNGYAGYTVSERKFRKWRKSTQITAFVVIPNTSSCHSERSEESHPGKERRFFAYALNDKGSNAEEHPLQFFILVLIRNPSDRFDILDFRKGHTQFLNILHIVYHHLDFPFEDPVFGFDG